MAEEVKDKTLPQGYAPPQGQVPPLQFGVEFNRE